MGDDSAGDADQVVTDEDRSGESTRGDGGMAEDEVFPRFETPSDSSESNAIQYGAVPLTDESPEDEAPPEALESSVLPTFEEPARAIGEPIIPTFEETSGGGLLPVAEETPARPGRKEDEPDFGIKGPEYDEEMPLADHIEEMIKRLAVVVVVAGAVTLVTFPFAEQIIVHLWYAMLPSGGEADPRIYHPLEYLLTQIKVASLAGIIIALPVLVYETYAFMRPGLYKHERRYYIAAIPTSLVLALVGVAFAYFVVLPAIFTYFMAYSQDAGEIAFALGQTFELILVLMAYLAIVFQIPLFIMLAIMMGLTTRRWLAEQRLYFWGAFLGISFITSPDPTGMAPIIIALTMVALFEGTLAILKWVGR